MMAIVQGNLHIDRVRRCVLIKFAGDERLVVWPPGTRLSPGEEAIVLADGTMIRNGDRITGRGGFMSLDSARQVIGPLEVSAECDGHQDEIAVFNNSARMSAITIATGP